MPNLSETKKKLRSSVPAKWILSHATPGERLRLKEGVYRHVKEREWILHKIDREGVHLLDESRAYGLIVRIEDIDWSELFTRWPKGSGKPSALS